MKNLILLVIIGTILYSCSAKVTTKLSSVKYEPFLMSMEVFVIDLNGVVPNNSQFVGDLKIGDSGLSTDCGFEKIRQDAEYSARTSGANLILLTDVKKPKFGSTCYRIRAKLYRNISENDINELREGRSRLNKSRLPDDANYAIVHFYRPKIFTFSAIGYDIKDNNDYIIGRVKNGSFFEYRIKDFGKQTFWAKTETKESIQVEVKKGQEYFIRCGVKVGTTIGRPELYLMENHVGIREKNEMN